MSTLNYEYLKDKIKELETNSKNKNMRSMHRGTGEFTTSYQFRTNFMNDENSDLFSDFFEHMEE
jgi:hypothetical protein